MEMLFPNANVKRVALVQKSAPCFCWLHEIAVNVFRSRSLTAGCKTENLGQGGGNLETGEEDWAREKGPGSCASGCVPMWHHHGMNSLPKAALFEDGLWNSIICFNPFQPGWAAIWLCSLHAKGIWEPGRWSGSTSTGTMYRPCHRGSQDLTAHGSSLGLFLSVLQHHVPRKHQTSLTPF